MCDVIKISGGKRKFQFNITSGIEETIPGFISQEEDFKNKLKDEFDKGFQEAVFSLEQKYKNEYDSKVEIEKQRFNNILNAIDGELQNYEKKYAELVVSLALEIAKKIVQIEIEINSPLLENIKSISKKMVGANYLLVKSNPEEIENLRQNSQDIFSEGNFAKIKFEADTRIEKGGFIIESDIGNVDGQINSQLNEIRKVLGISLNNQSPQ